MRKWGLIVTLFYAAVVSFLILPAGIALVGDWKGIAELHHHIVAVYAYPLTWAIVSVFILGQALLLTLTVDTTRQAPEAEDQPDHFRCDDSPIIGDSDICCCIMYRCCCEGRCFRQLGLGDPDRRLIGSVAHLGHRVLSFFSKP